MPDQKHSLPPMWTEKELASRKTIRDHFFTQITRDMQFIDPLPMVVTKPVVQDPHQVTVLHGGVLFALVQTEDGGLLACEWLVEGLTAPGVWDLDEERKKKPWSNVHTVTKKSSLTNWHRALNVDVMSVVIVP